MTRAREVSRLITTPPSIYATDTETSSAGYLTNASASSTYLTQANHEPSFRNYIINGAFNIWQRGTSFTEATLGASSAGAYSADRWQTHRASDPIQVTRQLSGLTGFQYCARIQKTSGNTKSTGLIISQTIETINSIPLAGKTFTLSFYARAGANFSATSSILTANIMTATGTDQSGYDTSIPGTGSFTGTVRTALNTNFNITTSWVRYSATGTFNADTNEIAVRIYYVPTGTAGANDYFEITGVQLEAEPIATSYEFKPIDYELAQCQRYFEWTGFYTTNWNTASTTARTGTNWLVAKRRSPDITFTDGFNQYGPGGQLNATSISSVQADAGGALFTFSQSGGLTTNAGSTSKISLKLDAEL